MEVYLFVYLFIYLLIFKDDDGFVGFNGDFMGF